MRSHWLICTTGQGRNIYVAFQRTYSSPDVYYIRWRLISPLYFIFNTLGEGHPTEVAGDIRHSNMRNRTITLVVTSREQFVLLTLGYNDITLSNGLISALESIPIYKTVGS